MTTAHSTSSVPSDLAVNRQWKSNADGYIFTVGYFTKEQIDSQEWETARIGSAATVHLCDHKEIVRRDVRWFEPIAPGEPQCAAVVYSFACTPRRPEWGSSLEYERRQAILEGLPGPITANCGEKDGTRMTPVRIPEPSGYALVGRTDLCDSVLPDVVTGGFQLRDVNYIQERTTASFPYVRSNRPLSGNPAGFLGQAAVAGQQLHFVSSNRDLAHDRYNIFVDQVFTENGDGYCLTFTARQGSAVWQRTIKRDSIPALDIAMRGPTYHSNNPEQYWDVDTDSHLLQHMFALELGLDLPSGHPADVTIGGSGPLASPEAQTGQINSDTPYQQVPLETIFSDPRRYEGQFVETCGDAYLDRTILYLRGKIFGRSRGGMRLNRAMDEQGYVCLRVKVVSIPLAEERPLPEVNASHPDVVPRGWHLEVVQVVSSISFAPRQQ